MKREHFDMVVIGSGPAGEKGATQAAYFGKRVALVNRGERLGGAPVTTGGIPTKTLRETALYLTGFRRRDIYGLALQMTAQFALDRLHAREAEVSAMMEDAVRHNLERHGIEVVRGVAVLDRERVVTVTEAGGRERILTADVVLVATGSRPFHPPGIPFDDPDVHDSDTILRLDRLPSTIVVIGGGPVGCEYASLFTALGARVTLIDSAERLLPLLDGEISALVRHAFEEMGMRALIGCPPASIERTEGGLRVSVGDEILAPEKVLFAAGRAGNTEALGLEEAGVALNGRGRIVVDERYETSVAGIYAAGDVIGPPALASVSAEEGRVAACHAFGIAFKEAVDVLPPYGIYSLPEIAMVGMTEEEAGEAGIPYEVGRARFAENARSRIAGTTEGLVKLVFDRNDRRLLGVHIVGEEAAELVHVGQAAIHANEPIDRFIHSTFNVPTRSEAYKYAAYDGLQRMQERSPLARSSSDEYRRVGGAAVGGAGVSKEAEAEEGDGDGQEERP